MKPISKWLQISFLNLLLVSVLGFILRYKIAFSLPIVDQKNVLHSHSHFAFNGWVSQTLMLLLIYYLSSQLREQIWARYKWFVYANLITAYGMMVAFFLQGYAFYSISFSTLSIIVSVLFAISFWRDLNRISGKSVSHLWFRSALIFSVFSALGPFSLAYLMAIKQADQNLYLASVYFFLHFQYNGWFFFAGMGLLTNQLQTDPYSSKKLYYAFYLFCAACIPAYFLSILWMPLAGQIYYLLITAVLAQLIGWSLTVGVIIKNSKLLSEKWPKAGRVLLILSAIAFTIKLILQSGSIHPQLSQLTYGFRPIIIGYLHLVLLGVTTIFIIGYIISLKLIMLSKKVIVGVSIFVAGVIINEVLLLIQGVAALNYSVIPHIQILLFGAAIILVVGLGILFAGSLERRVK
ncbi:hypothetical protein [Daejeonella sp.]|uniref:hypothetical protein n=1 Tax=Daejeonella sp. TaxID=2805397 RepID=UPI0030C5C50E